MMIPVVFLVSANAIAREGLTRILRGEGLSVARSAASVEGLALKQGEGGLVIIARDTHEARMDALRELAATLSSARPVLLSASFDFEFMVDCFAAGAEGYLIDDMDVLGLVESLRLIAAGQKVLPSALASQILTSASTSAGKPTETPIEDVQFSPREQEAMRCLAAGYSNKAIARELGVSEPTAKIHVKAILRKLKATNRTQAALWAVQRGFDLSRPDKDIGQDDDRIAA